jgi:hypothetical protein
LTHVLVEHHPDDEGERVPAEQLVGGCVLGDPDRRHARDGVLPRRGCDHLRQRSPSMDGAIADRSAA